MPERHPPRLRLLRTLRRSAHRYDGLRAASQALSLVLLLAVPLSGLVRLDLWRGHHLLLFRRAPLAHAVAGVIVGIAVLYAITFLGNLVAGRLFCGWGCPVGQVARFGEADAAALTTRERRRASLESTGFTLLLVLAILAWWVDLRVLVLGSPAALAAGWAALALGLTLGAVHGRWWRFEFCKQACPIGLYYSFVSPARWFGVHLGDAGGWCIDCGACDRICPVSLAPRSLELPVSARGGLAVAGAPGRNHCLECGDCVRVCEHVLAGRASPGIPLLLGFYRGAQSVGPAAGPRPGATHGFGPERETVVGASR